MLSIDQKGLALEFKAFGLDNNFKDLLLSGRVGFHSIDGEQSFKRVNLAPGESITHTSIGSLDHPTLLVVRAEPRAPGKGVLVAQLAWPQPLADLTAYSPLTGRAGATPNYAGSVAGTGRFELDKLFVWSGIFSSITLTNPATNPSTVQVAILEG